MDLSPSFSLLFQIPQMTPSIQQLQQPSNHQISGSQQQGPPVHVPTGQANAVRHIPPQQGTSSQMPQQAPPTQIGLPPVSQGHMGSTPAGPVAPAGHVPAGAMVNIPPQIGSQQPSTLPGTQGPSISAHVYNAAISSQGTGVIQVPAGLGSGPVPTTSQALAGPPASGVATMQGIPQNPAAAQSMPFQSTPPAPTAANEASQNEEDTKPRTAELISFD